MNKKTNNRNKASLSSAFEKQWVQIVLLVILVFISYLPSLKVPFQFDDILQIVQNSTLHDFGNYFNRDFWFSVNQRPLSVFTLALNYHFGGDRVFGFHIVNLLIHALNGLVLYLFLTKVVRYLKNQNIETNKSLPFIITLFFLVNTVQVQAVTYIVQRMTSLASFFFIASVYLYFLARIERFNPQNYIKQYLLFFLSIVCAIAGILSKQNVVVIPLMMMMLELFLIRNNEGKVSKKYVLIFASLLASMLVFLMIHGLPYETLKVSRSNYFATQMFVITRYFLTMLFPVGLSVDHGISFATSFFETKVMLGIGYNLLMLVSAIYMFNKNRLYSFGIIWIYVTLLVESSIIPIQDAMFDHRMYLPLAGFSLAFWSLLSKLTENIKYRWIFVLAVLSLLTISTYARNLVWTDSVKLWKQVTEKYPQHERGWIGLAYAYNWEEEKTIDEVINCYEKAFAINPKNEKTLYDLCMICIEANQVPKAYKYARLLRYSSNTAHKLEALNFLGATEYKNGKIEVAIEYFKEVLTIDDRNENAIKFLSAINMDLENYDEVIKLSGLLLEINQEQQIAYYYLGKAYSNVNQLEKAKYNLEKYLQFNPDNVEVLLLNVTVCINMKKYQQAIDGLTKAYNLTHDENFINYRKQVEAMSKL